MIAMAACLLGIILSLVGAELPTDTGFIEALPIWLTIACTAAFLLTTSGQAIGHIIGDLKLSPLLAICLNGMSTVGLVTIPLALMCLPIDALMPDSDSLFGTLDADNPLSALFWSWADQYLNLLPAVAGFWLFIKALDLALPNRTNQIDTVAITDGVNVVQPIETSKPADKSLMSTPSALERRFPEIAGLRLCAIEADEHYIRLHMETSSHHVLYRFRDALKDVEDMKGLRVHRSWWVAEDAIEDLEQSGSSFELKLKVGLTIPVSQTYRRDVERVFKDQSKSS